MTAAQALAQSVALLWTRKIESSIFNNRTAEDFAGERAIVVSARNSSRDCNKQSESICCSPVSTFLEVHSQAPASDFSPLEPRQILSQCYLLIAPSPILM